jgi:hypothetical protein
LASEASGDRVRSPHWRAALAEAVALMGDVDNARLLVEEAIIQVERPGREERVHYAEILRLKGWMLLLDIMEQPPLTLRITPLPQ